MTYLDNFSADYNFSNLTDVDSCGDDFFNFEKNLAIIFNIIWCLIAVVGVLANSSVLIVMLCTTRFTSATQYFIVNLAISDLLFLLICPTLVMLNYNGLVNYTKLPFIIASIICKLDYFSSHVSKIFIFNSNFTFFNIFYWYFKDDRFYNLFNTYVYDLWPVFSYHASVESPVLQK